MADKKLLISGLASTPFIGGGLTGALLSANFNENLKEVIQTPYKDALLRKGFKVSKSYGVSIWILKQYKEFPKSIDNLGDWCKKNEKISEEDNPELSKQFKEFCFETIATEIDGIPEFAILKVGPFGEQEDEQAWDLAFKKFKEAFQDNKKPSPYGKWKNTEDLKEFKEQCKTNEKLPYIDENKELFEEVKKYCTRKRNLEPLS